MDRGHFSDYVALNKIVFFFYMDLHWLYLGNIVRPWEVSICKCVHACILSPRSTPRTPEDHMENEKHMLVSTNGAGTTGQPNAKKKKKEPRHGTYIFCKD